MIFFFRIPVSTVDKMRPLKIWECLLHLENGSTQLTLCYKNDDR